MSMSKPVPTPRQIAPQLAGGVRRENFGARFPPHVKAALRLIARDEGRSMSYVAEEVVIQFFGLRRPQYRKPQSGVYRPANPMRRGVAKGGVR